MKKWIGDNGYAKLLVEIYEEIVGFLRLITRGLLRLLPFYQGSFCLFHLVLHQIILYLDLKDCLVNIQYIFKWFLYQRAQLHYYLLQPLPRKMLLDYSNLLRLPGILLVILGHRMFTLRLQFLIQTPCLHADLLFYQQDH
jgi:hypothetical protein